LKGVPGTNVLAYFVAMSVKKKELYNWQHSYKALFVAAAK
jgi:hypothetical protein